MNFAHRELDISKYQADVAAQLEKDDCHIFIDTSILSQLFKLNTEARNDFFKWVDSCKDRFHVPNWVVMEYNKFVYTNRLCDFVDELNEAKKVCTNLNSLQPFLWGYVDEEELQGTSYTGKKQALLDEMKAICDKLQKVVKAVCSNRSNHVEKVQKDIEDYLAPLVMDTDIYSIIENLYYDYHLRLKSEVPPGFRDSKKETNYMGDLIIWKEILGYCKTRNIVNAVFISRDGKRDTTYEPGIQTINDRTASQNERQDVAHESMLYEFKLNANDSEEFRIINFKTLVEILSDKYKELAFSFQLVSRNDQLAHDSDQTTEQIVGNEETELAHDNDWAKELTAENEEPDIVIAAQSAKEKITELECEYSSVALKDKDYLEYCKNVDLKSCIERLRSHNWYAQNDAILDLRKLLEREWANTQDNKDSFFVIGRNILQSADGNSFEAFRFIENMPSALKGKADYVKKAIVDGCLYEVFFDSNNERRQNGYKTKYLKEVVKGAKGIGLTNPFDFVNNALTQIKGIFVPRIEDTSDHRFRFTFDKPHKGLDHYHTLSLTIDGIDMSTSFSHRWEALFAGTDELKKRLSEYYAVPEEHIILENIPDDITYVHHIKQKETDLETLF